MTGQDEILVAVQRPDDLFGHDIAAAVTGNNQSKDAFFRKSLPVRPEQGSEAVEKGHDVGPDGIVIVGADEDQRIALAHGGIDLFHHDAAVEAVSPFAKVQAGLITAAPAVHDRPVAQGYFLYPRRREIAAHHFPQQQGIAGTAAAGVERQNAAPAFWRRCKG